MTSAVNVPCAYSSLTPTTSFPYASDQRSVKGEDVVFSHEDDDRRGYRLFAVCDGHHGPECATFVRDNLWSYLRPLLPSLPASQKDEDTFQYLIKIREAMVRAFMKVDEAWYEKKKHSGSTLTAALLIGRLLTVANVGDSSAFVHDGERFFEVTQTHRLDDNPNEMMRLMKKGLQLGGLDASLKKPAKEGERGYGPCRIWPGGLAVARSIGDADVTPHVLCIPHIHQLVVPESGARLIMATDGMWDVMRMKNVKKLVKRKSRNKCTHALVETVVVAQSGELQDDVSVTVVDILKKIDDEDHNQQQDRHNLHHKKKKKDDFKRVLQAKRKERGESKLTKMIRRTPKKTVQTFDGFLANEDGIRTLPEESWTKKLDSISTDARNFIPQNFTGRDQRRVQEAMGKL